MIFTLEILKTVALLCASSQYPQIQYTCERVTIHCITNQKPEKTDGPKLVDAEMIVRCFTEDRGK